MRRSPTMGVRGLAGVVLLGGCTNVNPTEPVVLVEIPIRSQMLAGVGSTFALSATATNAAGDEVSQTVTWSSDDPSVASVDAEGVLQAHTIGSTYVRAEAGGLTSSPVLVWVANPAQGAVLVADDDVVEGPTPVDATTPLAIGSRVQAVIAGIDVPSAGTILMATQDLPLAGKVVSASAGTGGVAVELEVVPLSELLIDVDLEIEDTITFEPAPEQPNGLVEVPGFECESESSMDFTPTATLEGTPTDKLTLKRDARLKQSSTDLERVMVKVSGRIQLDVEGTLTFPLDLATKLTCKREITDKIRAPFPAPLSFLAVKVPVGVGFELEGTFTSTAVVFHAKGYARADIAVGFDWTAAGGMQKIQSYVPGHGMEVTWDSPLLQDGATVKASAFPFVYAELNVGPIAFGPDLELAEVRAGVKGEYELSPPDDQTGSPTLASKYKLAFHGELQAGSHVATILGWCGISDTTLNFDPPEDAAILKSPEGTTAKSTDEIVAGQPVTLSADLLPSSVNFTDGYNVKSMHVWRNHATDGWSEVTELAAAAGQTHFAYQWTPTQADVTAGDAEFAMTVETLEMPGVQLEIGPDSRQQLGAPDGEALAAMQGMYDVVQTTVSPSGSYVEPFQDKWEILPTYIRWYDTNGNGTWTSMFPYGAPEDPFKTTFSGTSISYANLVTFPDQPGCGQQLNSRITITGTVTLNPDGSAGIVISQLVEMGMELPDCSTLDNWTRHDFVGTKPAP